MFKSLSKPTIAVDVDWVLAKLLQKVLDCYNEDHNDIITVKDIKSWDIHNHVKIGSKIYEYFNEYGMFRDLEIVENSQEVIQFLQKKWEVIIVTDAFFSPNAMIDKYNWLRKNFDFIPKNNIVFASNKGLIKADFLIDDAPHNLVNFNKSGGFPILFDATHNKWCNEYFRVNDWLEIKECFDDRSNELYVNVKKLAIA